SVQQIGTRATDVGDDEPAPIERCGDERCAARLGGPAVAVAQLAIGPIDGGQQALAGAAAAATEDAGDHIDGALAGAGCPLLGSESIGDQPEWQIGPAEDCVKIAFSLAALLGS